MICACGHKAISHQYHLRSRTNMGECLAPQCPCVGMVEES